MTDQTRAVFSALDNAKTQLYHFKAIVIAGMGFFTDAYDLFCISAVTKLIGRLYYYNPSKSSPGTLPDNVNNAITGVALCGTLAGQLFFGWLGDKLGRKKVYGITLITMVGCAIASGLSFGSTAQSVITTLCFFRFWLGFGIGGDYPLSAVIMSEYANQRTRGGFIAAVFAMQGMGILVAGAVAMGVSKAFLSAYPAPEFYDDHVLSTQPQGDFVWRIVLMFGAIPAALTYYWRLKMPETARYTALVEGNHLKAAADMAKVLDGGIIVEEPGPKAPVNSNSSYGLFSSEFLKRHGLHLLGTSSTWFLLDIAFYSLQLAQKDIYPAIGLVRKNSAMNAIEEVFLISKAMLLVALFATVPGYWFTVFLIDKIGRFVIQLGGFLLMSIFMAIMGFKYQEFRGHKCTSDHPRQDYCNSKSTLFAVFYGLTLFFANFGPNSTTFIVPAELFPARFRSTCHGISAASGKAGAIIGAFVVQKFTQKDNGIKRAIIALAVVNLLGFFFTFLVPETKGRSLEEISGEDKDLAGGGTEANGQNNGTDTVLKDDMV
ncbi:low affinity inorganic phosphate transporter 8-like isoform X2 [Diospyros lotus]|uniref:low affinity inorganic phosphate transporter 8-like isoform X2 n=1 Tax=Diospyros lotus TaxID=55363 RepID=UPI00225495A0|nr:low affinity inorganic phosphate transporter 8-like isoform X2 [Diospyros lotus]XP_052195283.1 low affinity inorganic phosphate transporter 8-like isoform X2 [Diospyros lotus]XP_052195292.1 low affinity inorganic phosphate transporter 8-like isoform X2 [Diospyros lotus]